jgi:hypothetical protein
VTQEEVAQQLHRTTGQPSPGDAAAAGHTADEPARSDADPPPQDPASKQPPGRAEETG